MTIKRLNYFNGQFLREEDFNDEQGYHLTMRRTHNNRAHSQGVVDGLEVEVTTTTTNQVTVSAGMAIDQLGREIILNAATLVSVNASDVDAYIVIALEETKTDTSEEAGVSGETRWTEKPVFDVVAAMPISAVGLAKISAVAGDGTVTLDAAYRRIYSAPVVEGDLTVGRDLTVQGNLEVQGQTTLIETDQMRGNVVLGDEVTDSITVMGYMVGNTTTEKLDLRGDVLLGNIDSDTVTLNGSMVTGNSSTKLELASSVNVTGDLEISGQVDGRNVSDDGTRLDNHVTDTGNPHTTTASQVDIQGGANQIVSQINVGTGIVAEARIDSAIARVARFNTASGHDHDGSDSKKISPSNLAGVNARVTAANLNVLTSGSTSDAAALHTHPFTPDDNSVTLSKLDDVARLRVIRSPLLSQSLYPTSSYINIGDYNSIAFDGTYLWVANRSSNCVSKVDPNTNTVITNVVVGYSPSALAFDSGYLWVANFGSSTVSKVDVAAGTIVATINTGAGSNGLAVTAGYLWITNSYNNNVSKLDMATNTVVATIPVGNRPGGLAVVGSFLWVSNENSNSVSKIDMTTNTVVATVSVGNRPRGVTAAAGTFLWVANYTGNSVSKVDAGSNTVATTINVPGNPVEVTVIGGFLWVGTTNQTHKIDMATNSIVASVYAPVGYWGNGMANVGTFLWIAGSRQTTKIDVATNIVVSSLYLTDSRGMAFDGRYMWVVVYGSALVLKVDINTNQIVLTVLVGINPHSIVYNGSYVFVTNSGSNSVSKIDYETGAVIATIPVGVKPTGIAYNPYYRNVWVANSGDGTASMIRQNGTTVAATYPVGANPQGVACESNWVWFTCVDDNTVVKLGGWGNSTIYATVKVGIAPQAIVFDFFTMWVANSGTNSLSKIAVNANTAVTVSLPAGANPARMCFDGKYLLVKCSNNIAYRVDTLTDAVVQIPNSLSLLGDGTTYGAVALDGLYVWGALLTNGMVYKVLI